MINKTTSLLDLVKVYPKIIPNSTCKFIMKNSDSIQWRTHKWSNYSKVVDSRSVDTEFVTSSAGNMIKLQLNPVINECLDNYKTDNKFVTYGYSNPKLNRYDVGTKMLPHYDHIYTTFDGNIRGIPILSIVGLLNDDFEGGEFVFWNDEVIKLVAGDILVFPSLFAYPHQVKTITKGSRYSFVSWAY